MAWLDRLARTLFGSDADEEFDREAAFHLRQRTEENLARGLSPHDARLEARRRFGSPIVARERTRDEDTLPWLADLLDDLRYTARTLRRAPVYVWGSVIAVALGVGANVAVFSVVNTVLVRPLPYPGADRLVTLGYTFRGAWVPRMSPAKFATWQRDAQPLERIAAYRQQTVGFRHGGDAEPIDAALVSADFFTLFGAHPVSGRLFTAADDRPESPPTAVLSHSAWQQYFSGETTVLGLTVVVDDTPATIVGVLAPSFDAPFAGRPPALWLPLRIHPDNTDQPPSLLATGRLGPGVNLTAANAQARLMGNAFRARFPDASTPSDTFRVAPFRDDLVGSSRQALLVLMGAVTFVLLIACANVATLLLVRASGRQREIALRSALGAGRVRVGRLLLVEGFVLSGVGSVVGFVLGQLSVPVLSRSDLIDLPLLALGRSAIVPDWRVLAFTVLASMVTCVACSVAPVLHLLRSDLRASLTAAPVGTTPLTHPARLRSALIVGQISVALTLLVGAALLIRTFVALRTVERGFKSANVLALQVLPSAAGDPTSAGVNRQVATIVERLHGVTGVVAAAATCCLPLASDWKTSIAIVGERHAGSGPSVVSYRIVSPDYFEVLGIPLVRGRVFSDRDVNGAPAVAVVNQAMARRLWPDADPLVDRVLAFPGPAPTDEPPRQVIGIVGNALDGLLMNPAEQPTVYVPVAQLLDREVAGWPVGWLVRTQHLTSGLTRAVQDEMRRASDGRAIARTVALDAWVLEADGPARTNTLVFSAFAAAALVLALVGVFAVMASVVQHRTPELGIRLALGARTGQIQRLLYGYGSRLILSGIVVGVVGSAGLSRLLAGFLFKVNPLDARVFIAAPVCVAIAGLLAAWWAIRRAAAIEPTIWLRSE